MGPLDTLNHLLNLAAPALAVALMLPVFARLLGSGKGKRPAFWVQASVNFVVGLAVVLAGLLWGGHDGKMATYLALVLVCASTQWVLQRA